MNPVRVLGSGRDRSLIILKINIYFSLHLPGVTLHQEPREAAMPTKKQLQAKLDKLKKQNSERVKRYRQKQKELKNVRTKKTRS